MSTRFDILDRKEDYNRHNLMHRCGELTKCPERSQLWRSWMATAARWGMDEYPETHKDRQLRQSTERVGVLSAMLKATWEEYIIKNATRELAENPDDHSRAEQWSKGFDDGQDDRIYNHKRIKDEYLSDPDYCQGYNEGYGYELPESVYTGALEFANHYGVSAERIIDHQPGPTMTMITVEENFRGNPA